MDAAIIEAAQVAARHPQIDAANFDIGHLLGFDNGLADVLLGQRRVGNFTFARAAGARLAQADDIQRAVSGQFANHGTDF